MADYKQFFLELNIIDNEEYKILENSSTIDIVQENDNIIINLTIKNYLPLYIFMKIKMFTDYSDEDCFELKYSFEQQNFKFDVNNMIQTFNWITSSDTIHDIIIKKFFTSEENWKIEDDKIIFLFLNKKELDLIKGFVECYKINNILILEEYLVNFLKAKQIKYEIDNNKIKMLENKIKLEEEERLKKENEKMLLNEKKKIIENQKITQTNRIKTIKIKELENLDKSIFNKPNYTDWKQRMRVIVNAVIVSIPDEPTRSTKGKWLKFNIFDHTAGLTIKVFIATPNPDGNENNFKKDNYYAEFKPGDWINAQISLSCDKFTKFNIEGIIEKIIKIEPPKEFVRTTKNSAGRVELLTHSKMSAYDGVAEVDDIFKTAVDFKLEAIAVTNRFNTQSFPHIMSEAKKTNIKPIYGAEVDLANDEIECCINPIDARLDEAEYVVFDLETTGLSARFDDITEFGAIKVVDGQVVDKVDFFIKPRKKLSAKLEEKTHITNEMLEQQGMEIKEGLERIKKWIGNSILIAHNGINFDIRFLNMKFVEFGIEPCSNALIDTLQISRSINPDFSKHSLGFICRKNKIVYDEETAHRADFDADVLFQVWKIFYATLENQFGITNCLDINKKLLNKELRTKQYSNIVVLYAKNQLGIKELYKIISLSSTTYLAGVPRVVESLYKENSANLILANHPTESDVFDAALNDTVSVLREKIKKYDYIFVSSYKSLLHEINRGIYSLENIKEAISLIIKIASEQNKKVIAVSDAYYSHPWEKIAHDVIVFNKMIGGKNHRLFSYHDDNKVLPLQHIRTVEELSEDFAFVNDSKLLNKIIMGNTKDFIKNIDFSTKPIADGLFAPHIENEQELMRNLIDTTFKSQYKMAVPEFVNKRIEKELEIINNKNFWSIYWISHLLVKKSTDDGYVVGSRGSLGSSLISFLTNISEVNPLPPHYLCKKCGHSEWDTTVDDGCDLKPKKCPKCGMEMEGCGHLIPFETFLGTPDAAKVPDFDLNFSGEYQPIAHEFIRNLFGKDKAFRAGTVQTVADKTAFGFIKNYFDQVSPTIPHHTAEIEWIQKYVSGVKRTSGQHPGGIIVVPKDKDLIDFTPYNFPPEPDGEWFTTHFDYHSFEANLLKFDILGHDAPTCIKLFEEMTGVKYKDIPMNDEKVLKLFNSLDSINLSKDKINGIEIGVLGVPEFGTDFVIKMLKDIRPKSFSDLIRISGLSHGTNVWQGNQDMFVKRDKMSLEKLICCRDDIMNFLINCGVSDSLSFKIMEAVRKGKGLKPEWEAEMKKNNIADYYIEACNKIAYLFPKAHATAYTIMSWKIAWFKIYYPVHFYAVFFSIRTAVFDIETIAKGYDAILFKIRNYERSCREKDPNLKTKDHDLFPIYQVALEFYARGFKMSNINLEKSKANIYVVEGNTIIPPFTSLDGLGSAVAETIIAARKIKQFTSKKDLIERTKINRTQAAKLEEMGVLDSIKGRDIMCGSLFDD